MDIPTAAVDGVPNPLPESLSVLDVREDDEWDAGRLEGSLHIPLRELGERFTELPRGVQVLVVCRSGHRSAYATSYLVDQGSTRSTSTVGWPPGTAPGGRSRPTTVDRGRSCRPGWSPHGRGQDAGALGTAPVHSLVTYWPNAAMSFWSLVLSFFSRR